jgi:hypothetical protein
MTEVMNTNIQSNIKGTVLCLCGVGGSGKEGKRNFIHDNFLYQMRNVGDESGQSVAHLI